MNKGKLLGLKIAKGGMKLIYLPIKLFPRRDKSVFISRQSDSVPLDMRLLKERIGELYPEHRVVILARQLRPSLGYILHTIRQMYHISTARNVVLDSYCIPVSVLNHKKNLNVIQMWHAIGSMKCFGYAMLGEEEGNDPEVAEIFRMHNNYDYILISSWNFFKDYEEGFHARRDQVREIPLPKVDLLTDKEYMGKLRSEIRNKLKLGGNMKASTDAETSYDKHDKKTVLYCPTFRKKGEEEGGKALDKLVKALDPDKYDIIFKPHPLSNLKARDDRVISFKGNNVEAMAIADYVISDYSSIIYEAGLAGRPVYLYAYDWEEYKKKRALNLDIEHDVPTVFTANPEEIAKAISSREYRWGEYGEFIRKNVTIPQDSCTDEILKLMALGEGD